MPAEAFLSAAEEILNLVAGLFRDAVSPLDAEIDTDHTLPMGKGALILVFGGLFALASSLFLAMFSPRPQPAGAPHRAGAQEVRFTSASTAAVQDRPRTQGRGRGRGRPRPRPMASSGRPWHDTLSEETRRCGYGQAEIVASGGGIWRIRLTACRSCRTRTVRSSREGCRSERRTIERVVRDVMPKAEVFETTCRSRLQDACIFEVRAGRS